ncbi:glutathione S-transferase family protein [Engelhardtia mirabilis]|uniref:glutathione transferase n=1 Tax=Engelhardtia mirabilis TaxID=2528011 RepID=A0A518BHB9_9BACT|nr:hypothetical protein Pla133_14490 [Planctomycetes bacterium Pla133]QDV00705.1 hypothetical protein Pla86_14480 [Planctomycetes bacterium Pla86]
MTPKLRLHQIAFSPNSIKIRLALGLKGLEHELVAVDPMDRSGVLALTGQPLTPTIEHGDVRLFGSGAILRYIDANFPEQGPRLFSPDRDGMRAIEEWERRSGEMVSAVGALLGLFLAGTSDAETSAAASKATHERTADLEARLAESPWLVGDAVTAADLTCAPVLYYAAVPEAAAAGSPLHAYFREHLRLGEGRENTRAWIDRCMAFDR